MALKELIHNGKTRLCISWGLVFCFCLFGCKTGKETEKGVSIIWENERAVALAIPADWLKEFPVDSLPAIVRVKLKYLTTPIFGDYTFNDTALVFRPLIPFSRGIQYNVWAGERLLEEVIVPAVPASQAPVLTAMRPNADTLPSNILKFYLEFSKPMMHGELYQYITLLKNGTDTVHGAFLELKEELWNAEANRVAVWFDPGRIKRDLQPNLLMGPPLTEGSRYLFIIDKQFRDTDGTAMREDFRKWFVAGPRDSLSPDVTTWKMQTPPAGSKEALVVNTGEPLDYAVLISSLWLTDESGAGVEGKVMPADDQKSFSFIPKNTWKKGQYTLRMEPRMEDLAGNNLIRPFDTDLAKQPVLVSKDRFKLLFRVK